MMEGLRHRDNADLHARSSDQDVVNGSVNTTVKPKRTRSSTENERNTRQRREDEQVTIKDENLPYLRELRKLYISREVLHKQNQDK